jgi:hypothetical protein
MKVFLLIALLCVVPLISGKAIDEATSKCLVTYLRNKGFLGVKDETPNEELSEDCWRIVRDGRDAEIDKFRRFFKTYQESFNNSDCVIDYLKKTEVFDRGLIGLLDLSKAIADKNTLNKSTTLAPVRGYIQGMKALI